jgi:hypothetical protein
LVLVAWLTTHWYEAASAEAGILDLGAEFGARYAGLSDDGLKRT